MILEVVHNHYALSKNLLTAFSLISSLLTRVGKDTKSSQDGNNNNGRDGTELINF
jgi:hypothetical protein